jgi:hypothetical protein
MQALLGLHENRTRGHLMAARPGDAGLAPALRVYWLTLLKLGDHPQHAHMAWLCLADCSGGCQQDAVLVQLRKGARNS